MKTKFFKILTIILAIGISIVPLQAFAAENVSQDENSRKTSITLSIPGTEETTKNNGMSGDVNIPLTDTDDPETPADETSSVLEGTPEGTVVFQAGDIKQGENDSAYDMTIGTVTQSGSISITVKDIQAVTNTDGESTDLSYVYSDLKPTQDNDLFTIDAGGAVIPSEGEKLPETAEGYEFVLLGTGACSQFYAGILYKTPAKEGETPAFVAPDGTPYYARRTDLGKSHQLEGAYLNGEMVAGTDTKYKGVWSNVAHYILMDGETGELITVYCADATTPSQDYYSYNFENVEDASYYTDEQAAMIKTVARYGFWGTEDDPATPEAEMGSIQAVKNMMKDAEDENGSKIFTEEDINTLNEGIAMTATQFAIWTFSNSMDDIEFINAHYIPKNESNIGKGYSYAHLKDIPQNEMESVALIFKLFNYLTKLEPTKTEDKTTANTVVNANNFIKEMFVSVFGKEDGHENNKDNDSTNDAYRSNINIALVVRPAENNDDSMLITLVDDSGNILAKGRIAGELQEGEIRLVPDEKGNYVFENVVLIEGRQQINFRVEGVQNLEEGVYLYTSEVIDDVSSQTFVGIANGAHAINTTLTLSFDLNIEDEEVTYRREWREDENNRVVTITQMRPPRSNTLTLNNTETIPDEALPLADVPKTADETEKVIIITAIAAAALAAVIATKKRKNKDENK